MKTLALAALLLAPFAAHAAPYTTQMTCAQAKGLVDKSGAIVLHHSQFIYDRYVAHQGYCGQGGGHTTRPAFVPTRDNGSCWVGYYCAQDNRGN